jgi:stage II sporulation protein AA (anti-sigma F factor antagonist)
MKIDATRDGGAARLALSGRLDREWAEHLSHTLDDLLRDGVRTLSLDLSEVSYISSAATRVIARWQQELAMLRGEVRVTALSPAVRDALAVLGWNVGTDGGRRSGPTSLQLSSWQLRSDLGTSGQYQMSSAGSDDTLYCRLYGRPRDLGHVAAGPTGCEAVNLPPGGFGLGLGAIGENWGECRERMGELLAVAGCVAYFPSDGARLPDYLVADGTAPARAMLASGLTCQGGFNRLVRFSAQPEAGSIPFSELLAVCLEAAGGRAAGLVIAAETAGLCGARLLRSPADGAVPFEVPAVRDWLAFAPERTYAMTTTLIAGVVARTPKEPLAAHLLPLELTERLFGHFHAAVFSYHPLPQRTVELGALARGLFANHELRDVLHLLWDDRGEAGVGESAFVRGVGWISPITQIG